MATLEEVYAKTYKRGDTVQKSGVYRVTHDRRHSEAHEVTVVFRKRFPPCNECGDRPRFKAVKLAQHIERNGDFK